MEKRLRGVIALKGLPCTGKTLVAALLGKWASCPVLYIDDFLNDDDDAGEGEERAFTRLSKAATRILRNNSIYNIEKSVIIKSRLGSVFELQQLLSITDQVPLLIIECQIRNEYQWKLRFQHQLYSVMQYGSRIRIRSWTDMERFRDDYAARSPAWDLHLQHYFLTPHRPNVVRRLVVDPFRDLGFHDESVDRHTWYDKLPREFTDAVEHILRATRCTYPCGDVQYQELRQYLFDEKLSATASRERSRSLCSECDCVFKYCSNLQDLKKEQYSCGACGEEVVRGTPAYACHFCILTMHPSCAQRFNWKPLLERGCDNPRSLNYLYCSFQTHLRSLLLPTIINHDSHPHFISFQHNYQNPICIACGDNCNAQNYYGCRRCAWCCHIHCAFLPVEVLKHEHGGHEHEMKFMFSRQGMEREESLWCNLCYEDMDPEVWFYSCPRCPYFATHLHCFGAYRKPFGNLKVIKYVEQIQSQLEEAIAGRERSAEPDN